MPLNKEIEECVIHEYLNTLNTARNIAKQFNVSNTTIWDILKRNNISTIKKPKRHTILTNKDLDIINGLLISDGSLHRKDRTNPNRQAHFSLSSKHSEFVNWTANNVSLELGTILEVTQSFKFGTFTRHDYISKTDGSLTKLDKLWYPESNNFKKVIPDNLEITPLMLKLWFVGDGCSLYNKTKTEIQVISLSTDGFNLEFIETICAKLNQLNLFFKVCKAKNNKYNLMMHRQDDCQFFLNYIGESYWRCFDYKWKLKIQL